MMAGHLRMALTELVHQAESDKDADFPREGVKMLAQAPMELEACQHLGAEWYERATGHRGQRTAIETGSRTRA